jgi:hypothetical protein
MVRAKSCFEVCQYAHLNEEASADGNDHRQLFTEDEISEDVVLGSRLHAAGFKGVFIAENLATGEVRAHVIWSFPPQASLDVSNVHALVFLHCDPISS